MKTENKNKNNKLKTKKLTTPSRKLWHTAEAPLTVFRNVILRLYKVL